MDNTIEVIKEYQNRYLNIRLICHTENKTAGGARNTGMDAAKGEYLWFVDPDDAIVSNKTVELYEYVHKHDLDILIFNYERTTNGKDVYENKQITQETDILPWQDFFIKYFPRRRMVDVVSIWRQLYKRSFCEENSLHYPEIKAAQDVVFAWSAFMKADRIAAIPTIGYTCYRRPTSTTGSKGRFAARAIVSQSLLFSYEVLKLKQNASNVNPILLNDLKSAICFALNVDVRNLLYTTRKEQYAFYQALQQNHEKIDKLQSYMNRKTKRLFLYSLPYPIWQAQIWMYKLVDNLKKREAVSY
jgi:glycosyltransferase involved in cell wall biosynthesis